MIGFNDTVNRSIIRRSCENVLNIFGFKRFELSEPEGVDTLTGKLEWEIDFFDREDKLRSVRFVRPPIGDESWFTKEIIRQLRENLAINK